MLLLLSGGMDSALCLAENPYSECITFDYGQRHKIEIDYAVDLAKRFKVNHRIIELPIFSSSALCGDKMMPSGIAEKPDSTYVPGRNVVFLSVACSIAEAKGHEAVIIGSNADDSRAYPDCRADFFNDFQRSLQKGMVNAPKILSPNILRTKKQVYELVRTKIGAQNTWSCYNPSGNVPCGYCGACTLREKAVDEVLCEK